jgi:hypothetical protein
VAGGTYRKAKAKGWGGKRNKVILLYTWKSLLEKSQSELKPLALN